MKGGFEMDRPELNPMKDARVYIIHGYLASPQDHWFPWLEERLTREGAAVTILPMPNSSEPDASAWIRFVETNVGLPDKNTFFIAHSLGCITLLRYLESLDSDRRIGGFVFVSGFSDSVETLPQLDEFTGKPLDYDRIVGISPYRSDIASLDDSIVPYGHTERLSRLLDSNLRTVGNGGHFLASDGFTQLPEAYEELAAIIDKQR